MSQYSGPLVSELGNDVLEEVADIIELLAAGRRRLRQEVEDFSVLEAVISQPCDPAILVEINRDDPLIPHLVGHERHRAPRGLRNIIKRFAAHGGDGGGRCLLYTSPSPRDGLLSRMPSS